jgi:hypothetical protein
VRRRRRLHFTCRHEVDRGVLGCDLVPA